MYEIDDEELDNQQMLTSQSTSQVKIQYRGMIKEIDIAGQKISVIEPSIVQDMQVTVQSLQNYVIKLENSLRNMNLKFANLERKIKSMEAELDNKVNYD